MEGCSGASGAGAGAGTAPPATMIDRSSDLTVATDGFFLLRTRFDPTSILGQTTVNVTTVDGMPVPGSLKVYSGTGQDYLGWTANGTLAVGTKLAVSVTPPPDTFSIGDSAELTVVGPPTPLEGASVSLTNWYDFRHGVGEPVTCAGVGFGCNQPLLTIHADEVQLHAADVGWVGQGQVNGFVLWEAVLELPADEQPLNPALTSTQLSASSTPMNLGKLVFPQKSPAYCASLRVHDLRSNQYVSAKTCGEPTVGPTIRDDDEVGACIEPPPGRLGEQWCAAHPESTLPTCHPATNQAPDTTSPSSPSTSQPEPFSDENGLANDQRGTSNTSSACQLRAGPARGLGTAAALMSLGLAAFLGRRRRHLAATELQSRRALSRG